jgi:hypothetical protein
VSWYLEINDKRYFSRKCLTVAFARVLVSESGIRLGLCVMACTVAVWLLCFSVSVEDCSTNHKTEARDTLSKILGL